jgi:hypothetical protein
MMIDQKPFPSRFSGILEGMSRKGIGAGPGHVRNRRVAELTNWRVDIAGVDGSVLMEDDEYVKGGGGSVVARLR